MVEDKAKLETFYRHIQKGALVKAIKSWKFSNLPYEAIEVDLLNAVEKAFKSENVGVILSAYYKIGKFAKYEISELLNILYSKRDYPAFLKQAYRFGVFEGFTTKIEYVLKWHEEKNLPDAFAWRLKFEKLKENLHLEKLSEINTNPQIEENKLSVRIIDEDQSDKDRNFAYYELKPIKRKEKTTIQKTIEEVEEQPYILSKVSKKKLENANLKHSSTLKILREELTKLGHEAIENKHIDLFSVIKGIPAIFEIKSINEDNENDQVRAAISQLYEYRFLYSLTNATLWLVFSEKPFSEWIIEYLTNDREIRILWVENDKLAGVAISQLC